MGISANRVSAVIGYELQKGFFNESSPNLPFPIVLLGEANTANQTGLNTDIVELSNLAQVNTLYGAGSPMAQAYRILKPVTGGGAQLPVLGLCVAAASGSAANVQTITVTGTANANNTHYVRVAGRDNVDGVFYAVNIVSGDTATATATKIKDAINAVPGSPVSASSSAGVVTVTAKWEGLTSQGIVLAMDTNNNAANVTYAIAEVTAGSGTPDIAAAVAKIGNNWYPLLVNGLGAVSATLTSLEAFNGKPDETNPTGRYVDEVWKPLIAITGSVADDPTSVTSGRRNALTIAIAPAPLSKGLPIEAAANMAVVFANQSNNAPHGDVINKVYPDMPLPDEGLIPAMQSSSRRDEVVKLGCSTVVIEGGQWKIVDFVTTYRPEGEVVPAYRWCSVLVKHFNVRFTDRLKKETYFHGKTLVGDNDVVEVDDFIQPKMARAILSDMFDELVARAIITDAAFSKKSIRVAISSTNPDRLNDEWDYKVTGITRVLSTKAKGGFNFGKVGS